METTVAVVDRAFLQEEMERTSLMALAIRTVATCFLDLNGQTAALLQEQTFVRAVDLCFRELALRGAGRRRALALGAVEPAARAHRREDEARRRRRSPSAWRGRRGFRSTRGDKLTLTEPRG